MANYNIKTTGTKLSGASTVDVWTDANCYNETNFTTRIEANLDTFVFDAGTYNPPGAWNLTSGVDISIRGNGAVIVMLPVVGHGFNISAGAGETISMNNIKLDGAACTASALAIGSGGSNSFTTNLNGVELLNGGATAGFFLGQRQGTINIDDVTLSGTYPGDLIQGGTAFGFAGTLDINIDGLHFNNVLGTNATAASGVLLEKGGYVNAVSCDVRNVTGSIDSTGFGAINGLKINGMNSLLIELNNFNVVNEDSVLGCYGIQVYGLDATNRRSDGAIVRDNFVGFHCNAGDGISFGRDTDTGLDYTANPDVHHNEIQGSYIAGHSPHGLVFRGLASGKGYANWIHRSNSPLMLSVCTSDNAMLYGNLMNDIYGIILSLKGNSGGQMHNNTAICTINTIEGQNSFPYGIWARAQSLVDNTASKTYNNNVLFLGQPPELWSFARVDTGHANTFSNNNYYTDEPLGDQPFHYNGTTYATLALWQAAIEASATGIANFAGNAEDIGTSAGYVALSDLLSSHTTYGGGLKWWTGPNPETLGEPLSNIDTDQGLQSTSSLLHPSKL